MKIEVLEKKKGKLKLKIEGETHTLLNLLRENSLKGGAEQSTYTIEHPYMSEPFIIVKSPDPKKTLSKATQEIIDQVKEFEKKFSSSK